MKKFMTILLAVMMVFSMTSLVLASGSSSTASWNSFEKVTVSATNPGGESVTIANNIIGYIQWAGYAIAVGMLIYVGIKYVMASANDKAEIKNALLKYVIGAVLIAGAVTIMRIFEGIGGTL